MLYATSSTDSNQGWMKKWHVIDFLTGIFICIKCADIISLCPTVLCAFQLLCVPEAASLSTEYYYYRGRTPSHSISPVCSVLEHPQTSVSAARTPSVSQTTQSLLSWSTVAVHPSGQIHSRELGISSMIITKWCNHSILVSYGVSEDFFFFV